MRGVGLKVSRHGSGNQRAPVTNSPPRLVKGDGPGTGLGFPLGSGLYTYYLQYWDVAAGVYFRQHFLLLVQLTKQWVKRRRRSGHVPPNTVHALRNSAEGEPCLARCR